MKTDSHYIAQKHCFRHAINVREKIDFGQNDKMLLQNHNLDEKIVTQYCSSIDFECMNRVFHGIAMRNMHNGFEFFNGDEFKSPQTIGVSGLVVVVNSLKYRNRSCLLFENFVDLLAYLTLKKHKLLGKYGKISSTSDYMVLSDPENLRFMLSRISDYSNLYCFFSNSLSGETLAMSVLSLHSRGFVDCSKLYSRCKTIADFLRLKKGVL